MRVSTPNLIGKRFGKLVVEKKSPEKGHATFWFCKCDCGNKTKVTTSNLLAGITKSCGCLDKENRAKFAKLNFKDLAGKRFGMLTVLRQSVGVKKGSGTTWFCKCDCGNYTDVASTKLIQGTTQSCGCRLRKAREKWKTIYKDEEVRKKIKNTMKKTDGREKDTKLSILKSSVSDKLRTNNASGVTGVSYSKRDKRWRSYITVKHVRYELGYFKDKESAIQARKKAEEELVQPILQKYEK